MSKYRRRRMKLKAHDRGDDRHEPGAAWARKKRRQAEEVARMKSQSRGASWQVRTSDGSEPAVTDRAAGWQPRDGAGSNSARRPSIKESVDV